MNRTESLPMVALRGMTILPEMVAHFDISRERSIEAVQEAMASDQKIFLLTQKDVEVENPGEADLYRVGTVATVKQIIKLPKQILRVLVSAEERAVLNTMEFNDPYLRANITIPEESDPDIAGEINREAMMRGLRDLYLDYAARMPKITKDMVNQIKEITELKKMVNQVAANMPLDYRELQEILEELDFDRRYELISFKLVNEMQIMNIRDEIQMKVKERVDKHQREYILREQLKLIREELGEDTTISDAEEFTQKAEALDAPDEVKEKLKKEIGRFKNSMQSPAEAGVIRTYIETMLEMPWNKRAEDFTDIAYAKELLEAEHYGLEEVKERVLEFLAVRGLTKGGESPIICLVGPPGTGKTSIARSVARALDKKYVRICLGGVKDEAEIRGHRRTYVGAMPGRLIQGIRQAGVKNPLMLLDEIDKMSSDYKGDPSSAMLEVLDSEQNAKFIDHYVDMPVDLSEVLFIATANDVHTIPRPLLDRMELIEVSSYTENEKMHIAKEHLLGKQIGKNGLEPEQLTITDEAMHQIISGYTREAGVRNLERKIGEICRKAAREIYEGTCESVFVDEKQLEQYLGKERFHVDRINEQDEIGIVRGLAWTSVGGDTLQIEVNVMPGKGEFKLTGQLGDVMKESAQAGISYIRSIGASYDIPEDFFTKHDIHIHIPEGAVPKDGPSAGITMATAMLSAITKKPVRADVAMTGEITLRGRVLPIGGLKEKLLAAKTAGIRTVCVPAQNEADIAEISEEIREGLQICYVKKMEEVLKIAMNGGTNDH